MGNIPSFSKPFARLGTCILAVLHTRQAKIHISRDNLNFVIATSAYITANVIDYLLTVAGVEDMPYREGNPIIQIYIEFFGARYGVLICKLLICIGVVCAMRVIYLAHKENKTWVRAEYILYGGAILTTLGGFLWLL